MCPEVEKVSLSEIRLRGVVTMLGTGGKVYVRFSRGLGRISSMETVRRAMPYMERSRTLRLRVSGSLLSRATLSKKPSVADFCTTSGDVLVFLS